MTVVAYVSGHGFGHAAREIEILRYLPAAIPLVVKSASPEWFWRQEMARPFTFVAEAFDVGCVQPDSIRIDIAATLQAWQAVDRQNRQRLSVEVEYLQQLGARVVVADVVPFALEAASLAGVPGLCVANFTWADIYEPFTAAEPAFAPIVHDLLRQYRLATCLLDTDLSLPMPYFARRETVGLVARPGGSRRGDLVAHLGPAVAGKRLALVYLGNWGFPFPYNRLEALRDWHFISIDAPPSPVSNWSVVPRPLMDHPQLVASVDLVVSKPGYGLVGECLSQGTPLLYCPRPQFAEWLALDAALTPWPGAFPLTLDAFLSVEWADTLARIPAYGTTSACPAPGGPRAATIINGFYGDVG